MKQTIIYKLNPNFEQEKHLHNLCSVATKLYNTDNWIRREEWEKTGKIPSVYVQKKLLKDNPFFKLLPSQTAQELSFTLQRNYNSWFKLRKKDSKARPPRFRKKEMLSPITFYQQFKVIGNKIRIVMSKKYSKEHNFKFIEIEFEDWKQLQGLPKMCQIVFRNGEWFAHIIYEVQEPSVELNNKIKAIDVGIINQATTVNNDGRSKIYSGREILAIQHYFNSRIARVQSKLPKNRKWSKTLSRLSGKKKRQINFSIHRISKGIVEDCRKEGIKTIVIGDITDIRKDKHFRKKESQKLHSWSFSKLTQQIEYKAVLSGIRFVRVNEKDTSKTCSCCSTIRKSNRIQRGLYRCKKCGRVLNSDVNGAINILKKYLQIFNPEDRSIGKVALPLVSRSRNVIPR